MALSIGTCTNLDLPQNVRALLYGAGGYCLPTRHTASPAEARPFQIFSVLLVTDGPSYGTEEDVGVDPYNTGRFDTENR